MDTTQKLKLLFNESYQLEYFPAVEREFDKDLLKLDKILCIVGPRRSGKTWLQFQLIHQLRQEGIPPENLVYFNFEDNRLYPLMGDEFQLFLPNYFESFRPKPKFPIYFFLDEIQTIPNWDRWIRTVYDTEKQVKLILSGSSSKFLSQEISTVLAGRTVTYTLLPFNFREFLKAKSIKFDWNHLTEHQIALVHNQLNEYLEWRGFPEITFTPK